MISDILQPTHLLFVLVVALLVLGPKRLPEAGRALGKGLRDFRSAISGEEDHHDGIPPEATATPTHPYNAAVPTAAAAPHDATVPPVATAPPTHTRHAPADAVAEPDEHQTETAHPVG